MKRIAVGRNRICVTCGREHTVSENISCCAGTIECDSCGCYIPFGDTRYTTTYGDVYCEDCGCVCERCGEVISRDDAIWIDSEDEYVCEDCLGEHYTQCYDCGGYFRNGSVDECTYVESADRYVCDDCLEKYYFRCDSCGDYFPKEYVCVYEEESFCEDCYAERVEAEGLLVTEEVEEGETA